ncbi:hypothetical protein H6F61_27295 [Cyanobacteria bacterium FACHB-472]|nr:hypothetical protein [Cyanobacteria bacterium FACHB-472]
MSWWDINGEDNNVIGDVPIDILKKALKEIVKFQEDRNQLKPTLKDILKAFAVVLQENQVASTSVSEQSGFVKLCVSFESSSASIYVDNVLSAETSIVAIFRSAFKEIAQAYEQRWERKPELCEWLETLEFILRVHAEHLFSDTKGLEIKRITAS